MKVLCVVLIFAVYGRADDNSTAPASRQQKAMLFFDDDGNLVKNFVNPYLQALAQYAARKPEHENVLKYFFNFLRPLIINTSTAAFMIPVSESVVQQINEDPLYQNKITISKRGPEFNPLCVGRRTQIPTPSSCNSFLSCWDGWAYELQCPDGLMFSNEGYCDYTDKVQCKGRVLALSQAPLPQCRQDFETFRNEWNCNEFYVCVNRKPVKFKCPADLAYSQQFGVCDYPNFVDCTTASSNPSPSPAPPAPSSTELPPPMNKPSLVQNPFPPNIGNLPATFPSIVAGEINKIPHSSFLDNRSPNIIPGINADAALETKAPEFHFKPKVTEGSAIYMQNSIYNNQNWPSPVAAMSPQDAVRLLKFQDFINNSP
ncbi:hypothetical protein ACJJTC_001245 [Scirpophaga incertulas]